MSIGTWQIVESEKKLRPGRRGGQNLRTLPCIINIYDQSYETCACGVDVQEKDFELYHGLKSSFP